MGFIIYGRAHYGVVDEQDGEFACTLFAHLNFLPLYPVQSLWIMERPGDALGFATRLNPRSVAAAYLRFWGPGLAVCLFITSSALPVMAAVAALVGLSAWSWTWRSRRGERAWRRGDFDQVALGSRCPPAQLTDDMSERLERELQKRHARASDPRPPDDVARFGARDLGEAVLAYGLLRLSAIRRPAANATADRLLNSAFETLASDGGPYRERLADSAPEFAAAISAIAQARGVRTSAGRADATPRWYLRLWVQILALIVVTPVLWAVARDPELGLLGPRAIGATELGSVDPPHHQRVAVTCDRVEEEPRSTLEKYSVYERVTLCWVGSRVLLVLSGDGDADSRVEGELRALRNERWAKVVGKRIPLDRQSFGLYLAPTDGVLRRTLFAICATALLAQIAGWVLWFRRRAQRARIAR